MQHGTIYIAEETSCHLKNRYDYLAIFAVEKCKRIAVRSINESQSRFAFTLGL